MSSSGAPGPSLPAAGGAPAPELPKRRKERTCPDCGGIQFVEDHAAGDLVCKGCGLVVEEHIIDERSEWRTFSDKDKDNGDPNRVGGPTNPLLEGGGLTTIIAKGADGAAYNLTRMHARNNNPDKALRDAFSRLGDLAERLRLAGGDVKTRACELYKEGVTSGRLKGRSTDAICAACMFMACRQNNTPRTFKEITALMPLQVRKKDISACFKDLFAMLKDKGANKDLSRLAPTSQHPADYMKRWSSELRLPMRVTRALEDFALAVKPKEDSINSESFPWDSRAPLSLAATLLYVITLIEPGQPPLKMEDVTTLSEVAEGTIKGVYKDLFPYLPRFLPQGFNSPQQIAKLPAPDNKGTTTTHGKLVAARAAAAQAQAQVPSPPVPQKPATAPLAAPQAPPGPPKPQPPQLLLLQQLQQRQQQVQQQQLQQLQQLQQSRLIQKAAQLQ